MFGVFFSLNEEDEGSAFFDQLEMVMNNETDSFVVMDFLKNVTNSGPMYQYKGSFTTPPCTEGQIFNVFKNPQPISKA